MIPLGGSGNHSLVLDYNRKIRRPSFKNLNPDRLPVTEYAFMEGNPRLKAALSNDCSVSLALFDRYSITAGVTDTKGAFNRISTTDPALPGVMILRIDNVARYTTWHLDASLPLQIAPWWRMNMNLSGRRADVELLGRRRTVYGLQGYMVHSFLLPGSCSLDLDGFYRSPFLDGNVKTEFDPQIKLSLRRQFFSERLAASLFVSNLFDSGMIGLYADEADFRRNIRARYSFREFGLSLRYSFSAGKSGKTRKVETGAADEKARLQ
jgi:hypothetical protein